MSPTPSVEEVAKLLGLSSSDLRALNHGEVVTEERHSSNEKDLCLLLAVELPATLEKTWKFVSEEKVIEIQDATLAQGTINLQTFELEGFKFDHGTASHLSKFNLSSAEEKTFSHSHDKKAAFKQILSHRAKAYWEKGLKGIESYHGKNHKVSDDLETANKTALKVIHDATIKEEVTVVPSKSKHPECHKLMWSIVEGHDYTSIVLSHRMTYKRGEEGFITFVRKFYSGADFDSSMITVVVLPTAGGKKTAVFYVNHTYTSKVAGFAGGTKKNIGRKLMKGTLVETMEKAQKALAKYE